MDSPKDPWTWLEAINRLAPVYSDARFIWVGDGPLLQTVSERVKSIGLADRVLFLGQRNDVSELLRAMDVFVLSSLHEGLPISIAEAMATGLPTVAPNTGGIPEQVTSGVNGYLYEPGNATDLTQKLGRLLAEERIRTRFGTQALLRTRHNFEEARMVNRTVEVYEACCEARGSKGEGHDSPQFSVESVGGSR
jgi:glycosyltransferase involved in cell wall biosynthesis